MVYEASNDASFLQSDWFLLEYTSDWLIEPATNCNLQSIRQSISGCQNPDELKGESELGNRREYFVNRTSSRLGR